MAKIVKVVVLAIAGGIGGSFVLGRVDAGLFPDLASIIVIVAGTLIAFRMGWRISGKENNTESHE